MNEGSTHGQWQVDGPRTIDLERVTRLKVSLIGGAIDIVGHDEPSARIEIHSVAERPIRVAVNGGALEIDHAQVRWDNWLTTMREFRSSARAEISLVVPRDIALKLGAVSASALVTAIRGDASLTSVSGDITLDGVEGDVGMTTVSGELTARDHTGRIVVHTVSGDVTASGDIHAFRGDGVSADVFLEITGRPQSVVTSSVGGALTLRLAPGVPVDYSVATVNGRVRIDDERISIVRGRYHGTIAGDGGRAVDLRVSGVSGDIAVLHAALV